VSGGKDWILPDRVRYKVEMEQSLQRMLKLLLAGQTEEMKAGQEEIKVHQGKAEAKIRQEQLKEDIEGHMKALLVVSDLSREVEGRRGYFRRAFEQNEGHGYGGKSKSNGGRSGAARTP
jgi:hypothetical protein